MWLLQELERLLCSCDYHTALLPFRLLLQQRRLLPARPDLLERKMLRIFRLLPVRQHLPARLLPRRLHLERYLLHRRNPLWLHRLHLHLLPLWSIRVERQMCLPLRPAGQLDRRHQVCQRLP